MQSAGNFHNEIIILIFGIAEDIFDNTTSFNPSKDMFNDNADPGNKAVLLALFWGIVLAMVRRLKMFQSC